MNASNFLITLGVFLSEILGNFLESLFFKRYAWGLATESCLFLKQVFEWVNVEVCAECQISECVGIHGSISVKAE